MMMSYVVLSTQLHRVKREWTQADIRSIKSVAVLADGHIAALL